MNVLSLFDGISAGSVALERAGIKVEKYFASEVDQYSIKVAKKNYPQIIEIGNVKNVTYRDGILYTENANFEVKIDLLIGGSPCTTLSKAGVQWVSDDKKGFGGESGLFWEYARIKKELGNVSFLLENVKMKKKWMNEITSEMGVEPIIINSSKFSAQSRERCYWTNIKFENIQQKESDVKLSDVLEKEVGKNYWLSKKEKDYMDRETRDGRTHWDFCHHSDTDMKKSRTVVANFYKGVPYNVLIDQRNTMCSFWSCDFQLKDKEFCLMCEEMDNYQGENYPTAAVRKFTPLECERLQTIPDFYTHINGISKTQQYKMIGNSWTVDLVSHIFEGLAET